MRTLRALLLVLAAVVMGQAILPVMGCVPTALVSAGNIDPSMQEPSAVWTTTSTPFGGSTRTLIVGYNDESSAATTTGSVMGWAISTDNGQTFQKCNATEPACGPVTTSLVDGFKAFLRHPSLATDGAGNVVYVTLADTDGDPTTAERVVGVVSTNGGLTFGKTFPLNQDSCSDGVQDMPSATFDYTTKPPTLWVVWRHNGSGGSFGGCIRRYIVDSTGTLVPFEAAMDVTGMDRETVGGSQGGLIVQAGDGVVTVVYANTDEDDACPTTEHHGIAWASVSMYLKPFDSGGGFDTVDNARIFHSDSWQSCLSQASGALVQNSIRDFDFVRSPTGIQYVTISDTPTSVRLFMSPGAGTKGWESPTDTASPWLEWCPGTPIISFDSLSPTRNWKLVADGPCDRPFRAVGDPLRLMLPTVSADGNGRLAVATFSFLGVGGAASQLPTLSIGINDNPLLPGSTFQPALPPANLLDLDPSLPTALSVPQATDTQPFGAYFEMIAQQPTGGLDVPGCSVNGQFFPMVVRASDAGTPQVGVRGANVP